MTAALVFTFVTCFLVTVGVLVAVIGGTRESTVDELEDDVGSVYPDA